MPSERPAESRIRITCDADATRSVIEAARWCKSEGLSALDSQSVSTAVSELSRNILKYAGAGEISFSQRTTQGQTGISIVASDRGPGISDINAAMADHFSSSGTLGLGLPGVRRLMDEFDIQSAPGRGTRVSVVKWRDSTGAEIKAARAVRPGTVMRALHLQPAEQRDSRIDCAANLRPCRGERASGDIAIVIEREDHLVLAVIDALGHGYEASRVAFSAGSLLSGLEEREPTQIIAALHEHMRGGIGAAAGVAVFQPDSGDLTYCAVGNIAARIFGSRDARLGSNAGILGERVRSRSEQRTRLAAGDVLVLYSDGIRDRFELSDYPQLRYQASATVAKTLLDRFGKSHDDASCAVLRYSP